MAGGATGDGGVGTGSCFGSVAAGRSAGGDGWVDAVASGAAGGVDDGGTRGGEGALTGGTAVTVVGATAAGVGVAACLVGEALVAGCDGTGAVDTVVDGAVDTVAGGAGAACEESGADPPEG